MGNFPLKFSKKDNRDIPTDKSPLGRLIILLILLISIIYFWDYIEPYWERFSNWFHHLLNDVRDFVDK